MTQDNNIDLKVQTLSGSIDHSFNVHQSLQHVVDFTFEKLKIKPAPGEVWELRNGSTVLNLSLTIQAAGLSNGAVLKLVPRESGGGA